ncbi:MAG: hypothetical protein ACRYGK_06980 [Janthinobacterium lividum]
MPNNADGNQAQQQVAVEIAIKNEDGTLSLGKPLTFGTQNRRCRRWLLMGMKRLEKRLQGRKPGMKECGRISNPASELNI